MPDGTDPAAGGIIEPIPDGIPDGIDAAGGSIESTLDDSDGIESAGGCAPIRAGTDAAGGTDGFIEEGQPGC
jgi:hypothetical protein